MRNHRSHTIGSKPFLEDEDEDMVVIVKGVLDTMVIMVVIPQIPKKEKKSRIAPSEVEQSKAKQENEQCIQDKPPKNHESNYYRCGMKGHQVFTCRTPKHLTGLYQTLMKVKGKEIEMNFTDGDGLDLTYYDIDFFRGVSEKTDHFINDEKIVSEYNFALFKISSQLKLRGEKKKRHVRKNFYYILCLECAPIAVVSRA